MFRQQTSYALTLGVATLFTLAAAAGAQNFAFTLSPGQSVPPNNQSRASGSCSAVAQEVGGDMELSISCVHNVGDAVAAHIHLGPAGVNGGVVFPFDDPEEPAGVFVLTQEQWVQLITESFYVNVHSPQYPGGEIRGQVRFQSGQLADAAIFVALSGAQVVPPVTTAASGRCLITGDNLDSDPEVDLFCYHDVENPTAAHIHLAPAGTNGPVIINLGDPQSPIIVEDLAVPSGPGLELDPEDLDTLYVQVHSAANPPGELRGQIAGCIEGPQTLCLQDNRFQVKATWRDSFENAGSAMAVRESQDSGILWFFGPDNAEVLVKVLDACAPPFNRFWVFYAATTNVEFTITVTDTLADEVRQYTNDLGQAAPPVLDTDAFATCP